MALRPSELIGAAGRRYVFKQLIQERPHLGRVWLATSGEDKFVLKDLPESYFSHFNENIRPKVPESSFLRLPHDTIPNQRILVYKFMDDDFLHLVRKQISVQARKQILKASLRGIAELHSHDIVHLDIKPNNIMINYRGTGTEAIVEQVQIIDFENASHISDRMCIKGMLPGNDKWRSPEGHFRGKLSKPTDIFSFAVVCIYAMLGKVIFDVAEDYRKYESEGLLPYAFHLHRQVSFFGDREGLDGLVRNVDGEEAKRALLECFWTDRVADYHPYRPFSEWPNVTDDEFKDLIRKMTSLDPKRRATAREALEHPWFADCEID